MMHVRALSGLDAANYKRSILHSDECDWLEKNCFVDIWIELIHALRLEPRALLAFVVAIDFEGDQWTFFKPPHDELRALYGIDVQELNVWRPLLEHALEHVAPGKLISTEADAFWLPDTQGTDYRSRHTKTTIVIEDVDAHAGTLGYFHNAGYFRLQGDDFANLFRVGVPENPTFMPLFAELVRTDRLVRLPERELAESSFELLRAHSGRRPIENPVGRFAIRFSRDFPELQQRGLAHYHAWAFATLRQLGAAFELASIHLGWLAPHTTPELARAAERFRAISSTTKTLLLKVARAVHTGKPLDTVATFAELSRLWDEGMELLDGAFA